VVHHPFSHDEPWFGVKQVTATTKAKYRGLSTTLRSGRYDVRFIAAPVEMTCRCGNRLIETMK
jgi:hypothetical protein